MKALFTSEFLNSFENWISFKTKKKKKKMLNKNFLNDSFIQLAKYIHCKYSYLSKETSQQKIYMEQWNGYKIFLTLLVSFVCV